MLEILILSESKLGTLNTNIGLQKIMFCPSSTVKSRTGSLKDGIRSSKEGFQNYS